MKTFACRECQAQVRRPTAPLRCEACGAQRIGLFKLVEPSSQPPAAPPPSPPAAAAAAAAPAASPPAPPRAAALPIPQASAVPSPPVAERSAPPRPKSPTAPPAAAEPKVGDLLWRYPLPIPGQNLSVGAVRNCPAVDEQGRVYLAIGNRLVALVPERDQARVLWEYATGGTIPGSPAIGNDGNIRVHSRDGLLYCLTRAGEPAWTPAEVGQPLGWASPVVDPDGNTWVCDYHGGLLKVDPRGVRPRAPFFRSHQKFDSTPVIRDQRLYVGAEDGFVYCIALDAARGRNTWDHLAGRGQTEWYINSSPALVGDVLYVAGRDEFLYAFDLDGRLLWRLRLRGQMLASPIVDARGNVYVGLSLIRRGEKDLGKLVQVDGTTHRVRWECPGDGSVESTPVLGGDGVVYFGDNTGHVSAVDSDGRRLWRTDLKAPVRSAGTIAAPGRLLFGSDDGYLCCLCCSSESRAAGGWPK